MSHGPTTLLDVPTIRAALRECWEDSQAGPAGGHEEGGFILRDPMGKLSVLRWPKRVQDSITVPSHANCKIGDNDIVATFHSHPNTGSDYLQEPAETDKRAVRDDPDLKGGSYAGEFVISQSRIYLITPNGQLNEVAQTEVLLMEGD